MTVNGPADRLGSTSMSPRSGIVEGQVTADLSAPDLGAKGTVDLNRLNLAPLLGPGAAQRPDRPCDRRPGIRVRAGRRAGDRSPAQHLAFEARRRWPPVLCGNARSRPAAGPRITLTDAPRHRRHGHDERVHRAAGEGRAVAFDLKGRAAGVDLRKLPASTGTQAATNLAVSSYHVTASGGRIEGTATLQRSTAEGITIADGTVASSPPRGATCSNAARGGCRTWICSASARCSRSRRSTTRSMPRD